MGCCCSKQEIEDKETEKEKALKKQRWDPPPPPPEEEKVKEVLSETPKAKPKPKPSPPLAPSSPVLKPVEKETAKDELEKKPKPKPKPNEIPPSDDRSEQPQPSDDACSLSEVSNATSVTTRERDREEISTTSATSSLPRIPRGNANGYNRSYSGELVRGGSRRERSPAVVSGVGCRSGRTSPGPPSRNRSFSGNRNGVKRDVGERSGRRSLSPGAKRREVVGPGVPGEKLGVNRGVPIRRVPPLPANKAVAATAQLSEGGDGPGTEGEESFENPSVSLECFIFL
jgi:hypothetical protein